ncbi:unnamed protein product [Strongylus vulgaris]|uniref:PLAT domain-containing protein n=1 Tax=Strongylus vulgaris TaxID=40348 RepID=A0A3P7JAL0_STRVU|nr:unnamed protein product [Strongylus vulgaris]
MSIEGPTKLVPEVSLCSGHQAHPMNYQPSDSTDTTYTYEMRLANQITKTILRFPSVDTEFESHQVYEFSPVYPDIQPMLNILYTITMKTIASVGTFQPLLNLIGEEGESGMRKFVDDSKFDEGARHEFDIDAVNLGPLREIEVQIEGDEGSSWTADITVGLVDSGTEYIAEQA